MDALKEMTASEDFSRLDANKAKRHHYVPQLTLRGFAKEQNGAQRVFQMHTTGRKAPIRVSVRDAALRRRLYVAVDEDGRETNRHEGYLELIERHAAPALRRLIDDPVSLDPGDRATIAFFVAFQMMRTPAAAEQVTALANMAFQNAASETFSDRRAFAESYRERYESDASEEEVERFRQQVLNSVREGKVRVAGKNGADFASGFRHAAESVPPIIAFDWTLVRAPSGGFIVSDRGFAIHDPDPPFPWAGQGLMSSESSETLFPLSDCVALLIRPGAGRCRLGVTEASAEEVTRLNLRTFGWADSYVFARSQTVLDNVKVIARRRPAEVVRPKSLCAVIGLELDPDDPQLTDENRKRGWPAYLPGRDGSPLDYIVIPADRPHPELRRRADELAESRARKRLGLGPDEPADGRIVHLNLPVHG